MAVSGLVVPACVGLGAGAIIFLVSYCCYRYCSHHWRKKNLLERRHHSYAKRPEHKVQLGPLPATQLRTEKVTSEEFLPHGQVSSRSALSLFKPQNLQAATPTPEARPRTLREIALSNQAKQSTLQQSNSQRSRTGSGSNFKRKSRPSSDTQSESEHVDGLSSPRRRSFDSDDPDFCDSMSLALGLPNNADPNDGPNLGQVQFRLEYCYDSRCIRLHLLCAQNLPGKDMRGMCDPFMKVYFVDLRQMALGGKVNLGKSWRTQTHQRTLNPVLDERNDYPCDTLATAQFFAFLIHVYDYDRFSRNDVIGHVWFPLKNVDIASVPTIWKAIQKGKKIRTDEVQIPLGELQLAIGYQRSLHQLTVVVRHGRCLPRMALTGSTDPFVKVALFHHSQKIASKHTETKSQSQDPVFNKSFFFKLAQNVRAEEVQLVCKVKHRDSVVRTSLIGYVVIGHQASDDAARQHWESVLANDRAIETSLWHTIHAKKLTAK